MERGTARTVCIANGEGENLKVCARRATNMPNKSFAWTHAGFAMMRSPMSATSPIIAARFTSPCDTATAWKIRQE